MWAHNHSCRRNTGACQPVLRPAAPETTAGSTTVASKQPVSECWWPKHVENRPPASHLAEQKRRQEPDIGCRYSSHLVVDLLPEEVHLAWKDADPDIMSTCRVRTKVAQEIVSSARRVC